MRTSAIVAILAALALAGCSATGDFGRLRGEKAKDYEAIDPAVTGGVPASAFPLTDQERELRSLAKGLLIGADPKFNPYPFGERRAPAWRMPSRASEGEKYVETLVNGPFRSSTARYARLIDDTRDDIARADQFFAVARRVADLDDKRGRSLGHVRLPQEEILEARRRMRENMMLMEEVRNELARRTALYRHALERLVVSMPSPMAVEAERVRGELERRVAEIKVVGGPPTTAAVAHAKD